MIAGAERIERGLSRLLDWGAAGWLRAVLLTSLVALAVIVPGLAAMPVTDRDEARFAQASRQMVETGDLIDIRFQDQPRWKKPAGIYWMQAASASLLGGADAPILAYRLPSALGVLGAALAMLWAARPLAGPRGALLAAVMLPTALLATAEAHIAKTDAMLLLTAVVALGGLARLLPAGKADAAAERVPWSVAFAFWTALAAAILLKGPIVPVIVLLALVWLWIARRAVPPLGRLRPAPGLLWTVALVAPWLLAIWAISDGAFFAESVGRDLVGKVAEGQENHWGPPGLYLLLVWVTFWPWAGLLPQAAGWLWARRREDCLRLLAAWVVPFWLLLEVVPTKLPHYVLPLYAGLAVAVAAWVLSPDRTVSGRGLRRASAWLTAVPGVVLALALVVLPLALEGTVVLAALPFAAVGLGASLLAARAALEARPLAQVGAGLLAALALYPGVLQFGLPALQTGFPSPRIAELAAPWRACASGPLVSGGYREPSLVFLTETGTDLATPAAIAERLRRDPGALVLLEDRWRARIDAMWGDAAPALVERGSLGYFNVNRGSFETARLLTSDDPRWEPCAR